MRKAVLVLASVALAMLVVSGVAWAAKIRCEPGSTHDNPCYGTKHPDKMRGTIGRDYIMGWAHRPYRNFLDDHDTIYGYAKNDNIYGGNGRDRLRGGSGDDRIDGGNQGDKILGEGGDGILDDAATQKGGADWISGGPGNDTLVGWTGADTLYGGRGADELFGWRGGDHYFGDAGPDIIHASGEDTFQGDERDFVSCGDGFDRVGADDPGVDVIAADCEQIHYETPEQ